MISPLGYITLYFQSNVNTFELKDIKINKLKNIKKNKLKNEYECKIEKNIKYKYNYFETK